MINRFVHELKVILLLLILVIFPLSASALIKITAAENFYGELAKELGGDYVEVTMILNNPNQDPHLYNASPRVMKAIWDANVIIYNGANYDPWMTTLLDAAKSRSQQILVVADLLQIHAGENPHIWYNPEAMPRLAVMLTKILIARDEAHKKFYKNQLSNFQKDYQLYLRVIAEIKNKFRGTPITATEPIFGYLASSLGLVMKGEDFQWRIMNDASPSPRQIKDFERMLQEHKVRVLLFNQQVNSLLTQHLLQIAKKAGVPAVGVTEMQPSGLRYTQWMKQQLVSLQKALQK